MNENKRRRTPSSASGFTLVELMVVIAIIAVLATTAGVFLFGALDEADTTKAKAEIKSLKAAVTAYMLKNNRKLPESLDEVGPFMENGKVPEDPWGNPYHYTKDGSRDFTIISYGADGKAGGTVEVDKDINSKEF